MKIAIKGFATEGRIIKRGAVFANNDPAIKLNPDAFDDLEAHMAHRNGIEAATARPGQARNAKQPKSQGK